MSIKRIPSGLWQVRWRDKEGRQRARNFPFQRLAQDFWADLRRGAVPDGAPAERLTFAALTERWLRDHCDVVKAPSQQVDDRLRLGKHLLPAWGDRLAGSLTLGDAVELRGRIVALELKPKTVNDLMGLARKILGDACSWGLLPVNPLANLAPLRYQRPSFAYWMPEERDRFLAYCRTADPAFHDMVAVAVHTGLRRGELLGLLGDSLDFTRSVLIVKRARCPRTGVPVPTKSKRVREVPMNAVVRSIMESRRMIGPSQPLITGVPLHSGASRLLRLLAGRCGVTPIRFHDLRHTFASHMAMAGTDLAVLRILLGHADYTMTLRYAHLHPSRLEGTTDHLCAPRVHEPKTLQAKSR